MVKGIKTVRFVSVKRNDYLEDKTHEEKLNEKLNGYKSSYKILDVLRIDSNLYNRHRYLIKLGEKE